MSATTNDTQRKSLFRIPSLFEIFFGRLANWIRQLVKWRKQGLLKRALQERQRRTMRMEVLEPRLLLSADLTAGAGWGTNLALTAVDATHVQLSDGANTTGSIAMTGDGIINISRAALGDVTGDTLNVNLASLGILTPGSLLDIKFTGGLQSVVAQDLVELDNSGSFGFNFKLEADSAIRLNSTGSLTATGHDITLASSESNSVLGVSSFNFLADATHASVTVLGDLSANNIALKADSTIDVKTDSFSLGSVAKLAFLVGNSTANVDVMGSSNITATSKLELLANSTVKIVADMTSDGAHTGDRRCTRKATRSWAFCSKRKMVAKAIPR